MPAVYVAKSDGFWWSGGTQGPSWLSGTAKPGFALVVDDQFSGGTLNSRWTAYDASNSNSTFGSPTRIQKYQAANAVVGTGTTGSTGGTSLKLIVNETDAGSGTLPSTTDAGTRYSYTAGMLDSKSSGTYFPRYGFFEWRAKSPHGQGLWPSFWLTAKVGGATTAEYDIFEYFHAQVPGKNSSTIWGTNNAGVNNGTMKYTNNGNAANGIGGRTFFEAPTATPGWHTWGAEIVPVTDGTGNTTADPTQPSSYVRLTVYLDGVQAWRVVDVTALDYTTNGGSEDSFWNCYLQGAQVDGKYAGHPRDPALGYSHWLNQCLISGAVGSCAVSTGGYTVRRAQFDGTANVTEIDYFRCWKYTG